MIAPNFSFLAFFSKSAISISPLDVDLTTTISIPANFADAKLVPCAEDGIRHTFLSLLPLASCYFLIAARPLYSPLEPELGWSETPSIPVIAVNHVSKSLITLE